MRSAARRLSQSLAILSIAVLAIVVAACSSPAAGNLGTSGAPTAPAPTTMAAGESGTPTEAPSSNEPEPSQVTTTDTAWGTILDGVPAGFPVYPDSQVADLPPTPVSAAFITAASVDDVATWYRDELEALGYSALDLSDPLEDGSRVLDTQADLPECRIQVTFRPMGESTMITVLYAAGCAGGEG